MSASFGRSLRSPVLLPRVAPPRRSHLHAPFDLHGERNFLGEPEVDDLQIPVRVDHDVFRFEVAVRDAFAVNVPQPFHNVRRVEFDERGR